jgi:hypothetical protein
MDVTSLSRMHLELRDCEIQAMFDHFTHRRSDIMGRGWVASPALGESIESAHDRDLRDFLCHLLDAAYFELASDGVTLLLRLPAFVEPPLAMREEPTLMEVSPVPGRRCAACPDGPTDANRPLDESISARWIRDKLLVPRSFAGEPSMAQLSQSSAGPMSSRPSRCASAKKQEHGNPQRV